MTLNINHILLIQVEDQMTIIGNHQMCHDSSYFVTEVQRHLTAHTPIKRAIIPSSQIFRTGTTFYRLHQHQYASISGCKKGMVRARHILV